MLIKLKVLGHVTWNVIYLKCHSFLKRWNILPHGFIPGLVLATKTSCEGGGSRGYGQTLVWLNGWSHAWCCHIDFCKMVNDCGNQILSFCVTRGELSHAGFANMPLSRVNLMQRGAKCVAGMADSADTGSISSLATVLIL